MMGAIWCNLLKIREYKDGQAPQLFAKLCELKNEKLERLIDKDTIQDRSNLLITKASSENGLTEDITLKPDEFKLR